MVLEFLANGKALIRWKNVALKFVSYLIRLIFAHQT